MCRLTRHEDASIDDFIDVLEEAAIRFQQTEHFFTHVVERTVIRYIQTNHLTCAFLPARLAQHHASTASAFTCLGSARELS